MPVAVLSSLALKGVLEEFKAPFEHALGTALEMRFDATQAIVAQRASGFGCDLLVLTAEAMSELEKAREVSSVRALGSSGVGVAVRAGAPQPDISSAEKLKRALESASSVAHSKVGASGIYFAQLIEQLPIKLKKRVVVEKGPVGLIVARGEAEMGIQQLCELAPVRGIDIVGPLPPSLQKMTDFAAGIPIGAANPKGAGALLDLMRSDAARAAMVKGGLQPA